MLARLSLLSYFSWLSYFFTHRPKDLAPLHIDNFASLTNSISHIHTHTHTCNRCALHFLCYIYSRTTHHISQNMRHECVDIRGTSCISSLCCRSVPGLITMRFPLFRPYSHSLVSLFSRYPICTATTVPRIVLHFSLPLTLVTLFFLRFLFSYAFFVLQNFSFYFLLLVRDSFTKETTSFAQKIIMRCECH